MCNEQVPHQTYTDRLEADCQPLGASLLLCPPTVSVSKFNGSHCDAGHCPVLTKEFYYDEEGLDDYEE